MELFEPKNPNPNPESQSPPPSSPPPHDVDPPPSEHTSEEVVKQDLLQNLNSSHSDHTPEVEIDDELRDLNSNGKSEDDEEDGEESVKDGWTDECRGSYVNKDNNVDCNGLVDNESKSEGDALNEELHNLTLIPADQMPEKTLIVEVQNLNLNGKSEEDEKEEDKENFKDGWSDGYDGYAVNSYNNEETLKEELQNINLNGQLEEDEKDRDREENFTDGWRDAYDGYAANSYNEGWNVESNNGDKIEEFQFKDDDGRLEQRYPVRPDAEDCSFYLRTGMCKYGSNCRFNHPVKKKNQVGRDKMNERGFNERPSQMECKYYSRTGGCKFGKACRYNHSRGRTSVAPVMEYNFLGLPIRPGEKECPYYMRTGSCKYEANCRFNHPDPTSGSDSPSGYGNGGSGMSQPSVPSWSPSPSRQLNEAGPLVPMIYSPTSGIPPQNLEWNGYQAPIYPPERNMHPSTAFATTNPLIMGEEFPERPGQPECSYFLKTGDCKYRSNCKFHHPKNRIPRLSCAVTDKGLPLRPDQNICMHYSRYGICKFGPNCKYDHPINTSTVSEPDYRQAFDDSTIPLGFGLGGSGDGRDGLIQQPV